MAGRVPFGTNSVWAVGKRCVWERDAIVGEGSQTKPVVGPLRGTLTLI